MISPVHFNGNLLCAIDTETSGLNPATHDLLQICILPLGPDFAPSRQFPHFEIKIQPEAPNAQNMKVKKTLLHAATTYGIERWAAVELLREWFYKLKLPMGKKIVPLGANWIHDRDFLKEFMGGPESLDEIFRSDFRDVQLAALVINDLHDWQSEAIPFPKTYLAYLATTLGVKHINKHDATGDALATAEIYRRLMHYKDSWNPLPIPNEEIYDEQIEQFIAGYEAALDKKKYTRLFLARTGRTNA